MEDKTTSKSSAKRNPPLRWSIGVKLTIAFLALAIIPMSAAAYYNLTQGQGEVAKVTTENVMELSRSTAQRIEGLLVENQRTSATLAGEPLAAQFLAASEDEREVLSLQVYQMLQNFADTHPDYDAPGLLDADGIVVASLEERLLGKDRSFRDYFQASIQGQPYVSSMLVGRATGRPGVFLTNPVITAEGEIVGIDIVWLKGDTIWSIIDDVVVGKEGIAYLVDQDGVIIAHPNRDLLYHSLGELTPEAVATISATIRFGTAEGTDTVLIPESLGLDGLAAELVSPPQSPPIPGGKSGTYRYHSPLDHRDHVAGYTRLEAYPWTVVVDLPEAQFLAPLQRLRSVAWGSVGVVGAITLIVSILLARTITRPIHRLTDTAMAVEQGRPFEPADIADVTAGRDEIAQLGRVFCRMVLALHQREEKIEHLSLVLRAIRNVNQLIVRERDCDRLLQSACEGLIETRGYHNAWIALLGEKGDLVKAAEAGLGESFLSLVERLERGELTACGRGALEQSGVVVIQDPLSACADCPLSATCADRWAMTVRLEHGEKVYGLMSVSIPADFAADEEERSLFKEVAGDIAFALYGIELEDKRRRAEEAAQKSAERYRSLFENSPVGLYRTTPEGRILHANPALVQMLGYPDRKALMAINVADGYANAEERQRWQATIEREGAVSGFESQWRCYDGTTIWVRETARAIRDAEGRVVRYDGAVEDITERVRSEEERARAEERIEHLNAVLRAIRSVNQLIVRERDRDRLLQSACEGFIETRGYHNAWIALLGEKGDLVKAAEAGLGESFLSLVERLKRGELTACGRRALEQSGIVAIQDPLSACADCPLSAMYAGRGAMTVRLEHRGKVYGLVSVSTPAHLAADEEELGLFEEVAGDIALALHSMELEERRKRAEERARQQERLAAVGQLAGGIAHDFNNLLTTIILYAQMPLGKQDLPPDVTRAFETILAESRRAAELVRQILDFSRRSPIETRPLDLKPFVKEAVRILERTVPESISLLLEVAPGECVVNADPTRVQQVLMNLAVNARDAMTSSSSVETPEGGKLRVELTRLEVKPDESPPVEEMPVGEWVCLAVSDTGTGIPPQVLSHIFEPFFTTKGPGEGVGLGLAQVYGIVKQHEGYIGVETEVGKGTTFRVYLPAHGVETMEWAEVEEASTPPQGKGETILLVEDSERIREAGREVLESLGYRVLVAANGREALEVHEAEGRVDLVITDLVMPEMGGRRLVRDLRKETPDLKALAITGHIVEEDLRKLRKEGFLDIIYKPLDVHKLATAVRQALDEG